MDLSLEFLQAAIAPHASTTLANARNRQRFRGVRILHPGTTPRKDILYLCGDDVQTLSDSQAAAFADAGLITAGVAEPGRAAAAAAGPEPAARPEPAAGSEQAAGTGPATCANPPAGVPAIHFDGIDPVEAFNLASDTFDLFENWSRRVLEQALTMPDLDSLMSLLNEVTPNPWYIADGSYRVLAARNAPDVEDLSYIWRFLYRNRRLPLETVLAMEDMGKIEQMSRRKKAYIPTVTPFNIPFVSKSVAVPGGAVAHFYIIGVYTLLSQYEIEIADFFGDVLNRVLAREGEVFPGAVRFYDSFLSDLAAGVIANDADEIMQKMYADFDWNPSDQLALAVFEGRSKEGSASDAQRISALESRCDARGFYRDGHMAAVINLTRSKKGERIDGEEHLRIVRPLARELKCKVGLSERFSGFGDLLKMRVWYEQAHFAAGVPERSFEEAGETAGDAGGAGSSGGAGSAPAIRTFASVAMLYFRERVVRSDCLAAFRHPGLDVLRDYDDKHGTALFETLRTYLQNDRNAIAAAGILFIHRNTLLKRLRKIATLTSIDLDDPECRKRLLATLAAS